MDFLENTCLASSSGVCDFKPRMGLLLKTVDTVQGWYSHMQTFLISWILRQFSSLRKMQCVSVEIRRVWAASESVRGCVETWPPITVSAMTGPTLALVCAACLTTGVSNNAPFLEKLHYDYIKARDSWPREWALPPGQHLGHIHPAQLLQPVRHLPPPVHAGHRHLKQGVQREGVHQIQVRVY